MKRNLPSVLFNRSKILRKTAILMLCSFIGLTISAQKPLTKVSDTWKNGSWESSTRETMIYDGSGYLTTVIYDSWDPDLLEWVTQTRSTYTNNADGTPSVVLSQDLVGTDWVTSSRTTYSYNGSGKMTTVVSEMWMGAAWLNLLRLQITYDGNGFVTNYLYLGWDMVSSTWKNSMQVNLTNNANGNPTEAILQSWQTNAWVNSSRTTSAYNGSGDVTQEVSYTWVTGTPGSWQVDTRDSYTYDGSTYLTRLLSEKWDINTQAWVNKTQTNYTNNNSGFPLVEITQSWDGIGAWVNADRVTYTYGTPTLVREYSYDQNLVVYPNPAADYIKIKTEEQLEGLSYSITNQAGKPVMRGILNTNEDPTIDISTLSNGVYFLKIGDNGRGSYKILKNKAR